MDDSKLQSNKNDRHHQDTLKQESFNKEEKEDSENTSKSQPTVDRIKSENESIKRTRDQEDLYKFNANSRTIFIGNLSFTVSEEELIDFFSKVGAVESAKIPKKNGRSKGVGFVIFELVQSALESIKTYNEQILFGRKAYIRLASDTPPPIPRNKNQKNQTDRHEKYKSKQDYRRRSYNYDYQSDYDYYNDYYSDDYRDYSPRRNRHPRYSSRYNDDHYYSRDYRRYRPRHADNFDMRNRNDNPYSHYSRFS